MDKVPTLHDKYSYTSEMIGGFGEVPQYITENLAHELRPYQTEAIGRFLFYLDRDQQNKTIPVQLLFNMATGSGKTLVMAALMIEMYKRGARNFIFFVNSTNIINKTRANFLEHDATKYLFAKQIMIDGRHVLVREVSNFSESRDDAINIVFTTIQGLHSDLNRPRENRLTYDELADHNVVLLSDEAHHLNAATKDSNKDIKDNTSWEATIANIMSLNPQNILLEFTATIDTNDASIWQKYNQRILFQYDLKAFRQDGFSKDVLIYEVDSSLVDRALQAIIISQYRKKVALAAGIWCKPVVMFKARTKAESKDFYEEFQEVITALNTSDIERQRLKASGILSLGLKYFNASNISDSDLVSELKNDFATERLILIDSDNRAADSQLLLNTLEERSNEIRAVFSVDMLDEGWDVLNLFDIVRLYDKRDSKNGRPGRTTLREAQLIGRGARYFPFPINDADRYIRKFDNNELEPLRSIEQLHYHSKHNPKYVQELTQALKETGIVPSDMVERTLKLKDSFKATHTYLKGVVWQNKQLTRAEARAQKQAKLLEDHYNLPTEVAITLPSSIGQEVAIFDTIPSTDTVTNEQVTKRIRLGDFPKSLVRTAIDRNNKFTFDQLEQAFIGIRSKKDFMFGASMLGGIEIEITGAKEDVSNPSAEHKLYIVSEVLRIIQEEIDHSKQEYIGSDDFEPIPVQEAFDATIKRKYATSESEDKEVGYPQYHSARYALNLAERDWHAYDENYGTSEEKSLVKMLDGMMEDLQRRWSDIYLLRNEKAIRLYDFDTGQAFEPDYILLANDKKHRSISWQVFIEPKGGQFIGASGTFDDGREAWKQRLLTRIADKFNAMTLAESKDYRVVGVPFYNENHTADLIRSDIEKISDGQPTS